MPVEMSMQGYRQLERTLDTLPGVFIKKAVRKATRAVAKDVMEFAKANAPVDSGALRDSLIVRATKLRRTQANKTKTGHQVTTRGRQLLKAAKGNNVFSGEQFYGLFMEYGFFHHGDHSFVAPQPFLRAGLYRDKASKRNTFHTILARELPAVAAQARAKGRLLG